MDITTLGDVILGAGALGTAAFGVVEALKWTRLGVAGYDQIPAMLGPPLMQALAVAYGDEYDSLLRAQYRKPGGEAELGRTLRQGVRIGLSPDNAAALATYIGRVDAFAFKGAIQALAEGKDLSDAQRNLIGRFELAVDSRIESALSLASDRYIGMLRGVASVFAVVLGLVAAKLMNEDLALGFMVGIVAVPLAPIAKDVVAALKAATGALKSRA